MPFVTRNCQKTTACTSPEGATVWCKPTLLSARYSEQDRLNPECKKLVRCNRHSYIFCFCFSMAARRCCDSVVAETRLISRAPQQDVIAAGQMPIQTNLRPRFYCLLLVYVRHISKLSSSSHCEQIGVGTSCVHISHQLPVD